MKSSTKTPSSQTQTSHLRRSRILLLAACLSLLPLSACQELGDLFGPTPEPSASPTAYPSTGPTAYPSSYPSTSPTTYPSTYPTTNPATPTPVPTQTPLPSSLPSSPPGSSVAVWTGFTDSPAESVLTGSRFVLPGSPLSVSGNGSLSLSRNYYKPGKPISLDFVAGTSFASNAWVGVIPSDVPHGSEAVNDQNDLSYRYLEGKASGNLSFTAPLEEKSYDFRMNSGDGTDAVEAVSLGFVVTRELPPEETAQSHLSLSQSRFKPGKPIAVRFTAPASFDNNAWIGLLPADAPHGEEAENDKRDLAFKYLEGKTSGEFGFSAPSTEGAYTFRLHDNDSGGKEACYVSFTVSRDLPASEIAASSLRLDRTIYAPGDTIHLSYTAPVSFGSDAWIGLLPASAPHGEEAENDKRDLSFQYLKGTSGNMEFRAPAQPGSYDFRLHDNDSGGKEVVYVSFSVAG